MTNPNEVVTKESMDTFRRLGLTPNETRIYVSLLGLGPSSAREIGKRSGLRREDVYRTLNRLKSIGILEIIMNNPYIFVAVEPQLAVKILLDQLESRLSSTRKSAQFLVDSLRTIERSDRAKNYYDSIKSAFKLEGGSQIFQQMSRLVSGCKYELLRVVSLTGISLNYEHGIIDIERSIVSHDGKIRVITEVDRGQSGFQLLKDYSRIAEIRHLSGISSALKFVISDNSEMIFFTTNPNRDIRELGAIWTNNKHLIEGFRIDFEKSWKSSVSIDEAPSPLASRPLEEK